MEEPNEMTEVTDGIETTEDVVIKPRKQLSEKQMQSRRANLQKAIEARKAKAFLKEKAKKEEKELENLKNKKQEIKKEKEVLEKEIKNIEGDEEDEVLEEEDIEQVPKSKPLKPKKKKVIEISEDESSSSEEEIIVRRRKPHKKQVPVYEENDYVKLVQESAQNQLRKKLEEDKIRIAMSSLFR
jgi:hypothetical protein